MTSPVDPFDPDEDLVRSLLANQHPDLAHLPLRPLPPGWDNNLWRLGDDLLVRLPRRLVAVPLTLTEQRWLPELAPRLPLPVPTPVRAGGPTPGYPWPWSIVPWLEGRPGDEAPVSRPEDAARRLGRFLRALHTEAAPEAPSNPYRGVPLGERARTFEEMTGRLRTEIDVGAARRVWNRALAARPWDAPPVWVHGDLHPANTLFVDGTLAAVIDFGDLCAGDPATDLAGSWLLLPAPALPSFAAAYGPVDAPTRARSLGWAVLFALMLIAIGIDEHVGPPGQARRPTYEAVGRAALERVIRAG